MFMNVIGNGVRSMVTFGVLPCPCHFTMKMMVRSGLFKHDRRKSNNGIEL